VAAAAAASVLEYPGGSMTRSGSVVAASSSE
jgi:hypothetical protein